MKKLILTLATTFILTSLYAQDKEINAAFKAFEKNDKGTAKAELNKISNQIDNTIAPETLATYYYVKGELALAEGNIGEAAKSFGLMSKYEMGSIYSVKNKSTKKTEYYFTLAEAETAVATGDYTKPKEEKLKAIHTQNISEKLSGLAQSTINQASAAFQNNRNTEAAEKFLEAADLVESMGSDGNVFRYNAAMSYHRAGDFTKAAEVYVNLINNNYDGVSTIYRGKDHEGKDVAFTSKEEAENMKKLGVIKFFKEEKTPSVEKELFQYTLQALVQTKKLDPVVEKIDKKYPNDADIQTLIGNVYLASGNQAKFISKIQDNIKINPNDPVNYFNLGVIELDKGNDTEAIKYFNQAVEKAPKSETAKKSLNNIVLIKIKPEKEYIEVINANLGSNPKERKTYNEYVQKRKDLYNDIIPYLEKQLELDKNDLELVSTLKKSYQIVENFAKEDEMKALEKQLKGN